MLYYIFLWASLRKNVSCHKLPSITLSDIYFLLLNNRQCFISNLMYSMKVTLDVMSDKVTYPITKQLCPLLAFALCRYIASLCLLLPTVGICFPEWRQQGNNVGPPQYALALPIATVYLLRSLLYLPRKNNNKPTVILFVYAYDMLIFIISYG